MRGRDMTKKGGREGGKEGGERTYPAKSDDVVFLRGDEGSHLVIGDTDQKGGSGLLLMRV